MLVPKGKAGVKSAMKKFAAGKLHSGSKSGPKVTSRKQAIAISLSQAGMSKKKPSKASSSKKSVQGAPASSRFSGPTKSRQIRSY